MKNHAIFSLGDIKAFVEIEKEDFNRFHNDSPNSDVIIMLDEQIQPLIHTAQYIVEQIKAISPDELKLNFGIKANGEGGFLCFAKAGVEAHFNVTMTWNKKEQC